MLDDYERHQGVVLRQIIVGANTMIRVAPFQRSGRVNSFMVNEHVGVLVKHSSNRMSPWQFTFHREHIDDVSAIEAVSKKSYVAFVCGDDGIAVIDTPTLRQLISVEEKSQASIRISRTRRSLYRVSGNRDDLKSKVARGPGPILAVL